MAGTKCRKSFQRIHFVDRMGISYSFEYLTQEKGVATSVHVETWSSWSKRSCIRGPPHDSNSATPLEPNHNPCHGHHSQEDIPQTHTNNSTCFFESSSRVIPGTCIQKTNTRRGRWRELPSQKATGHNSENTVHNHQQKQETASLEETTTKIVDPTPARVLRAALSPLM